MQTVWKIKGFIPYVIILFLNATTDLAHKITIQNTLLKSFEGDMLITLSAVVNALILLPFLLLFSASGFLSDKFSKITIIRYSAIASIPIALLITLCYYQGWFVAAFVMTFLLALQSAIYSPAKYGAIKEFVGSENLGPANGVVQAVTIVAILLSSILFSFVFESLYTQSNDPNDIVQMIAPIGWILVALTTIETWFAFKLPQLKAAKPEVLFKLKKYVTFGYFFENTRLIFKDQNIWLSIIGLSLFWGAGQILIATFPAHYKLVTGDSDALIVQGILAVNAIGIVVGSITAGKSSYHHIELGLVPIGALGLSSALFMFAYVTEIPYMLLASLLFGFFGGLFIVPLNAMVQFFSSDTEMGTIMAGNNFVQNFVMISLLLLSIVVVNIGFSSIDMFLVSAMIMLFGALYAIAKLPHLFVRLIMIPIIHSRYSIKVNGIENLPQRGAVLLLGNHISWIDWLILQAASPRTIKFVMEKEIYYKWYVYWLLRYFKIIPISEKASRDSIKEIKKALDSDEIVALFPEGGISRDGGLKRFKKGFEFSVKDSKHLILPFNIQGLWGSRFTRSQTREKTAKGWSRKRHIKVTFGAIMPTSSTAAEVQEAVEALGS